MSKHVGRMPRTVIGSSCFPPEPGRYIRSRRETGPRSSRSRGRRRCIHHGFVHQFLDLVLLESVHQFFGLVGGAELAGLLGLVYVYLQYR